jgi:hypothetical protein
MLVSKRGIAVVETAALRETEVYACEHCDGVMWFIRAEDDPTPICAFCGDMPARSGSRETD